MARCRELYFYGIDNWGNGNGTVTSPSGSTYWYKDYANSDLRLIGIDTTLPWSGTLDKSDDLGQQTWLTSILNNARTNNKAVVIAQHYPPTSKSSASTRSRINCDFCSVGRDYGERGSYNSLSMNDAYLQIVQNFIDAGGKCVCWLGGHTHTDLVLKDNAYPDQIFFIVTSLWNDLRTSDQARTIGTCSFIAANVIGFDTQRKLIKISRVGANCNFNMRPRNVLVYDYDNKRVVYQSSGMQS